MAAAVASIVFLAGLVAIAVGVWLLSPAAGLISSGALAVITAVLMRRGSDGPSRPSA